MSQKSSFALVVPCYNEQDAIAHFAVELNEFHLKFKSRFPHMNFIVLVIDNNSTDQSALKLKALANEVSYMQILNCSVQGYGAALKHGFSSVEAELYGFTDLDNTYPLDSLLEMTALILNHGLQIDMISGGRLNEASQIPWVRRAGNSFYSKLTQLIFLNCNIVDTCSGMRIFKKAKLHEVLKLKENDLSFSIELTAHALKKSWSLKEFPIFYRDRVGSSKLSVLKDGFKFLYILITKKVSYADS